MAARATSPAERAVYETIAEGWRKLALEARRGELRETGGAKPAEPRATERKTRS